ncbi:uncharacterized protein LOC119735981 [Patiria miniata]|uniref:Uncharacterized protein n=1 Tax=Patiria miniata TaxID=46514 RepID=A0A914AR20_PATMI|nr:uncharacterized protein LOC119735981 [Patiria miniata]
MSMINVQNNEREFELPESTKRLKPEKCVLQDITNGLTEGLSEQEEQISGTETNSSSTVTQTQQLKTNGCASKEPTNELDADRHSPKGIKGSSEKKSNVMRPLLCSPTTSKMQQAQSKRHQGSEQKIKCDEAVALQPNHEQDATRPSPKGIKDSEQKIKCDEAVALQPNHEQDETSNSTETNKERELKLPKSTKQLKQEQYVPNITNGLTEGPSEQEDQFSRTEASSSSTVTQTHKTSAAH